MKKLFCFVALAATAFLSSCNNDDNSNTNNGNTTPPPPAEENPVTSIVLSSDITTIEAGDGSVTFNVADQGGNNVTTQCTIIVNNAALQGNIFTPTNGGTYTIKATYQELTSNTITITVTQEPDNAFTINNNEPVTTNNSNLIYTGTEGSINVWALIVRDGVPGNNIDDEPENYGLIVFSTIQPEGQQELAYPTPAGTIFNGGQFPGTLYAQFKTGGTTGTEIYSDETTTMLNIDLMEINTTASTWKFYYGLQSQNGTIVNGYFNGNYSFIDDSGSELDRKNRNTKVVRLSPEKIKENIASILKK